MSSSSITPQAKPISTRLLIFSILIMRVVMDTGTKLFFPYLSVIAAGLGTTPVEFGRMLSWRDLTGLLAPFLGVAADRRGYRLIVAGSLILSGIGFLIIFFSRSPAGFMVGILLGAVGSTGAGPNIVAYLSHRLPWDKRSRGLGTIEYAWGLASIIGVSLSGYLIALTSWRAPFLIIGIAAFIFAFVFTRFPPADRKFEADEQKAVAQNRPVIGLRQKLFDFVYLGPNWRSAVATLVASAFARFAGFLLFINYGTWLTREFDLSPAGLAAAVFWLGFSDIFGSVLVSFLGDWVGKRRSVIIGTLLGVLLFAVLPLWQGGLTIVLIGIFLVRSTFEFSIVSYVVLSSEQTPEHRGKLMAQSMVLSVAATFVATRFGPQLYESYGVAGFAWIAAISIGISCLIATFLVSDQPPAAEAISHKL